MTTEQEQADAIGRRYLIRFQEDTLRQRPLSGLHIDPAVTLAFTGRRV